MNYSVLKYLLVLIAPVALHFSAMLGQSLLQPIKTGLPRFDKAYNRYPLLFSSLCGFFLFFAVAVENLSATAYFASFVAAGLFFLIDSIGIGFSIYEYGRKP